jgi:branched-subunit amino acid transport protein
VIWAGVLLVAGISYVLRAAPLMLLSDRTLDPRVAPVLRDAGMGGLAALAALALVGTTPTLAPGTTTGVVASIVVGSWFAATGRSMALAMGAGLLVLGATWGLTLGLGW